MNNLSKGVWGMKCDRCGEEIPVGDEMDHYLERELATLRHMERVRGRLQAGKKIVCLWEA